jgi:hypothetical protein
MGKLKGGGGGGGCWGDSQVLLWSRRGGSPDRSDRELLCTWTLRECSHFVHQEGSPVEGQAGSLQLDRAARGHLVPIVVALSQCIDVFFTHGGLLSPSAKSVFAHVRGKLRRIGLQAEGRPLRENQVGPGAQREAERQGGRCACGRSPGMRCARGGLVHERTLRGGAGGAPGDAMCSGGLVHERRLRGGAGGAPGMRCACGRVGP